MMQGPFDSHSQLIPYWRWKVERLPKKLSDMQGDEWTQPVLSDYVLFKFEDFCDRTMPSVRAHFTPSRKGLLVLVHQVWVNGRTLAILGLLIL